MERVDLTGFAIDGIDVEMCEPDEDGEREVHVRLWPKLCAVTKLPPTEGDGALGLVFHVPAGIGTDDLREAVLMRIMVSLKHEVMEWLSVDGLIERPHSDENPAPAIE